MVAKLTMGTWLSSNRVWVTRYECHAMSSACYATGSPFEWMRWFPSAEFDPCCPGWDSVPSGPGDREGLADSRHFVAI